MVQKDWNLEVLLFSNLKEEMSLLFQGCEKRAGHDRNVGVTERRHWKVTGGYPLVVEAGLLSGMKVVMSSVGVQCSHLHCPRI